LATPA